VLVHETPSDNLAQPDSHLFLDSLRVRLDGETDTMEIDATGSQSSVAVVAAVDTAREQFYGKARDLRLGFGMMLRIQEALKSHGYKGLDWSLDEDKDNGLCAAMLDALRGRLGRDVKHLGIFVK
jgi:origin recognition complex subunit 3